MNALLRQIYQTKTVEDANGQKIDIFPTSISQDEGAALYHLIRQTDASKTMEIGLAYGLSTLFICQALQENGGGHHTAFDPLQHTLWQSIGLLNMERAKLTEMLRFYESSTHEILPKLLQNDEKFDFIFIDGAHLFDYVMLDFFYANLLLKENGYILLHDLWMPSVRKILSFILRNYNYTVDAQLTAKIQAKPPSQWRIPIKTIKSIATNPLEAHVWALPFSTKQIDLYTRNYCVLRKIGEDERQWDHYRSF